ncbi:MAG: alginate lyase family protein [Acidobacteria bacterium]|nr:alginate lyase family protein [Acidobacteriota bacterium]
MDRRGFCLGVAAGVFASYGFALGDKSDESPYALVARTDRKRILSAAARYLKEPVRTITAFPSERNPGGLHDFFSESDYFWPNPANPNGPYKERDGVTNPDNFLGHRKAMIALSVQMPALTAAWLLTKDVRYSRKAVQHLLAWFVHPATRMNPNLEYAQGVRNGVTGRSYGIIDTLHLVEVARAASVLGPDGCHHDTFAAIQDWFREYVHWMRTSAKGIKERDATNNHATCWGLQVAEFARLVKDDDALAEVRGIFAEKLVPQMAPEGYFPREVKRTKPYGYSIFNFDVLSALAWSLGETRDGRKALFAQKDMEGACVCKAAAWIFPYLKDKSKWPYAHDVQHWESWPVRSPGLLFSGLACGRGEYIQLWEKLDPDSTDPEVIRNFPVRQPLLWVS